MYVMSCFEDDAGFATEFSPCPPVDSSLVSENMAVVTESGLHQFRSPEPVPVVDRTVQDMQFPQQGTYL